MSRRRRADKREHAPDPRYSSPLVSHLINVVMLDGKKSTAQKIVYGAFERVSEELEKGDPIDLLLGALENIRPKLEVFPFDDVETAYARMMSGKARFRVVMDLAG